MCDKAAELSSVATNYNVYARSDSAVPVTSANNNTSSSTQTHTTTATATSNATSTLYTPPSTTQPPLLEPPSHSHSPPPTPLHAVAIDVCNELIESTSVATNSTVSARLDSTTSTATITDDTLTAHTHSTHTLLTQHTSTANSRPHTRTTSAPIHPFFIDLHTHTGKAAKHFRRLYTPTATICECGRYPIYAQQIRAPTSPPVVLPAPVQPLCLCCIADLRTELQTLKKKDSAGKPWLRLPV